MILVFFINKLTFSKKKKKKREREKANLKRILNQYWWADDGQNHDGGRE